MLFATVYNENPRNTKADVENVFVENDVREKKLSAAERKTVREKMLSINFLYSIKMLAYVFGCNNFNSSIRIQLQFVRQWGTKSCTTDLLPHFIPLNIH
jgi:hypothetical protein